MFHDPPAFAGSIGPSLGHLQGLQNTTITIVNIQVKQVAGPSIGRGGMGAHN